MYSITSNCTIQNGKIISEQQQPPGTPTCVQIDSKKLLDQMETNKNTIPNTAMKIAADRKIEALRKSLF